MPSIKFLRETNSALCDIWNTEDGITEATAKPSSNSWKMAAKSAGQGYWLDRYIGIAKAFGFKEEFDLFVALKKYLKSYGAKPHGIDTLADTAAETMVWAIEKMNPTDDQWRSIVWGLPYDTLKDSDLLKYRTDGKDSERSNKDEAKTNLSEASKYRPSDLKANPGDVFEIETGPSPHRDHRDAKEKVIITVVSMDDNGKTFYYFYGKGKPEGRGRVAHSNMFVWGIESFKKLGSVKKFKTGKYKEFQWTITGFENIDKQMANLGDQYQAFDKYAPQEAKDLYAEQEDQNYHTENGVLVASFLDWIGSGKNPKDFPVPESPF